MLLAVIGSHETNKPIAEEQLQYIHSGQYW